MPTELGTADEVVQIGEWIVDPALDTITRGAEIHKLEPRTTRLLMSLAGADGAVVSVDRLLTDVWSGVVVGSASVYQAVSQLRKLLGDEGPDPSYIATVPRKGYRLVARVVRNPRAVAAELSGPPAASSEQSPQRSAAASIATANPVKRRFSRTAAGIIALLALAAAGALLWKAAPMLEPSKAAPASIVVLPFLDLTAEKSDQIFCDGLTEELSNWLSQIPSLRVVARTSAFAFRGQNEDVRKIGAALNTNHILEGSMRRSGNRVRITAQLIDARDGYHLWSENFDRPMEDTIEVQEDISRSVAGALQIRLSSDSERQFAARRTADPQAYQTYLSARHYARLLTPASTDHAIDLYHQALSADPNYAPVYPSLAYALLNQGYFHDLPIADVAGRMEPLIAAALRLDNRLSSAYAVRGALRAAQSRVRESIDDLAFALSLNPSDMSAWAELGRIRLLDGQPRRALEGYDQAAALDPLNSFLQGQRCIAYQDLAQYDDAAIACARARVLQPDSASASNAEASLAESRGMIDKALDWNAASLKAGHGDDFDPYWMRANLLLSVGLIAPAHKAVDRGRAETRDEISANAALVRIVFREGGLEGLRHYLERTRVDESPHAIELFEAAYARLLLNDPAAVKQLIARALQAPDRPPGYAQAPWFARGARPAGTHYLLDLAAAEIALGERTAAMRDLTSLLGMIDAMIRAGVERGSTHELRARVLALQGRAEEALQELGNAEKLGWRRSWWALNEPYYASLQSRAGFQALMTRVSRANEAAAAKIPADP